MKIRKVKLGECEERLNLGKINLKRLSLECAKKVEFRNRKGKETYVLRS